MGKSTGASARVSSIIALGREGEETRGVGETFKTLSSLVALGKKIQKKEVKSVVRGLSGEEIGEVIEDLRSLEVGTKNESLTGIATWAGISESEVAGVLPEVVVFYERNIARSPSNPAKLSSRTEDIIWILEAILEEGRIRDFTL